MRVRRAEEGASDDSYQKYEHQALQCPLTSVIIGYSKASTSIPAFLLLRLILLARGATLRVSWAKKERTVVVMARQSQNSNRPSARQDTGSINTAAGCLHEALF